MSKEIFPESSRLKEIIESHKWTLYEGNKPRKRAYTWEEMEKRGPAENYQIGNNYIFAPIPINGQSLREAYSITKGFGPSLTVNNSEDRWITLYITEWSEKKGKPIFFSRLFFHEEGVAATSPNNRRDIDSDLIGVGYPHIIDTFEKYFRIVA